MELAIALGKFPHEIRQMPASDYLDLALYAREFPFGAIRDNLHAAIIAQAVLRPWVKRGTRIDLKQFMIKSDDARRQDRNVAFIQAMKAMAVRGKKHGDRSGKARRKARTAKQPVPERTGQGKQEAREVRLRRRPAR